MVIDIALRRVKASQLSVEVEDLLSGIRLSTFIGYSRSTMICGSIPLYPHSGSGFELRKSAVYVLNLPLTSASSAEDLSGIKTFVPEPLLSFSAKEFGSAEELIWPRGRATVRILCGTEGAP